MTFTVEVQNFVDLSKEAMRYVAINAIQDVMEAAQTPQPSAKRTGGSFVEGKIPVDDGVLINSLVSGINSAGGAVGASSYAAVLPGMDLGDTFIAEWRAIYAMRIEFGFVGTDALGRTYNQAGRHFVGKNAARFSEFVDARVAEVRV